MYLNKIINKNILLLVLMVLVLPGCEDFLNEDPKDELSEGTFWNTKSDALMGLMGCYERLNSGHITFDGWTVNTVYFSHWTDESTSIRTGEPAVFHQRASRQQIPKLASCGAINIKRSPGSTIFWKTSTKLR